MPLQVTLWEKRPLLIYVTTHQTNEQALVGASEGAVNPLTLLNDQETISPYNINTESTK